jgi:hypothetical protein
MIILRAVLAVAVCLGIAGGFSSSFADIESQEAAVSSSLEGEIKSEEADRAEDIRGMDEMVRGSEQATDLGDNY